MTRTASNLTVSVEGDIGTLDQLQTGPIAPLTTAIVDASGNQVTSFGGGTQYNDGAARGSATGTLALGDDGTNIQSVKVDSAGELQIDVLSIAAGDNNIGNVDIASSIPAGTNNIGDVDVLTIPGVVGTVADDATTPGNPVMVGGSSKNFDGSAPGNVSAEDDVSRSITDPNRRVYVNAVHPHFWSYHTDTAVAIVDKQIQASPGANHSIFITDIVVSSTSTVAGAQLFFEEGSTKILGPYYLEAVAGRGMAISFSTPKQVTANTAVTITANQATQKTIDITGFIARIN